MWEGVFQVTESYSSSFFSSLEMSPCATCPQARGHTACKLHSNALCITGYLHTPHVPLPGSSISKKELKERGYRGGDPCSQKLKMLRNAVMVLLLQENEVHRGTQKDKSVPVPSSSHEGYTSGKHIAEKYPDKLLFVDARHFFSLTCSSCYSLQ